MILTLHRASNGAQQRAHTRLSPSPILRSTPWPERRFAFPSPARSPILSPEASVASPRPAASPCGALRKFGDGSLCSLPQQRQPRSPSGPIRRRWRLCYALHLRRGDAPLAPRPLCRCPRSQTRSAAQFTPATLRQVEGRYENTERREKAIEEQGLLYLGMGVSGGEEGARHGPSLMPGGSFKAYKYIEDILLKVAAQVPDSGPCVTYVGKGGSGNFVKMVHNGIEYGDMQLSSLWLLLQSRHPWIPGSSVGLRRSAHLM